MVIPRRMAMKHVEPFVRQHRQWISEQIEKLGLDRPVELPETIHLAAITEHWSVHYEFGHGRTWRYIEREHRQLIIRGPDNETEQCIAVLNRWLRAQAKDFMPDLLDDISERCGLPYEKVTLRSQKSRWGSCSSRGNISLNDRLMLLPYEQLEYVMLHELCHTRHLNHSRDFWSLLASFIPDCRQRDRRLKKAQHALPSWTLCR